MSEVLSNFCFKEDLSNFPKTGATIARIPEGVSSKEQLLSIIASQLNLPDYFGFNWDALEESLCDLSWIDSTQVIIVHDSAPAIEQRDLRTYVEILSDCVEYWKAEEEHDLKVVFPSDTKFAFEKIFAE